MYKQINKKVDFILCLFLGYLGIHKFYEKKTLMGILYLFTLGLFLVGWIYDCIKLGIELYKTNNATSTTYEPKTETIEKTKLKYSTFENQIVTITHPNGKIEKVPDNLILDIDSYVLICDGGHTYHKCTGCFKKWPKIYQENFTGWKFISLKEAKQQGLTLCNFCEEALGYSIDNLIELDNENISDY